MLTRAGKTVEDLNPISRVGKILRRNGVRDSNELDRILRLPRRKWEDAPTLAGELQTWLRTHWGTMTLREIQAAALQELHDLGGLFAPIRVGGGKTLISFLAAAVVEAERPILLIPAKLRDKTRREMAALGEHWNFPIPRIITYEWLGRVGAAEFFETYRPDLIVADECHKLKNMEAAVTRRVNRYMSKNPKVRFAAMSGTITMRSLRDYAHIVEWCLGSFAPVPLKWTILSEWADALDEKLANGQRLAPGALIKLCEPGETPDLSATRKAFRRRLTESYGVIATHEKYVGCSLYITAIEPPLNEAVDEAFTTLRTLWETPDGWPISDGITMWRHARELACGFYYKWDPRPPREWLEARKQWCKFVRTTLKHRPVDSELQVAQGVAAGRIPDPAGFYETWKAIRDTFKTNTVPVWLDDSVIELADRWASESPGIVWVEHQAFGQRMAEQTGRHYYHRQGKNAVGGMIEDAHKFGVSIIASIASNKEGRNLQAWNRSLITSVLPNGEGMEQLLGRTHRDGQQADEVVYDVLMGCKEQWAGFEQARADARYIEDSIGQAQKLLYADVNVPTPDEVAERSLEIRWK